MTQDDVGILDDDGQAAAWDKDTQVLRRAFS